MTLILRSCTWIGMVLHKILDKALSSHNNWIKSIEGFAKKNEIVKHLSQNFYIKILSLWPSGLGMVPYKILDQFLSPCQTWINPSKASQKQTLCKLNTNFNTKILSPWPWPLKSCTGLGIVLHKILDQHLSSYQTWNKYTTGFGNNEVLKTLT